MSVRHVEVRVGESNPLRSTKPTPYYPLKHWEVGGYCFPLPTPWPHPRHISWLIARGSADAAMAVFALVFVIIGPALGLGT